MFVVKSLSQLAARLIALLICAASLSTFSNASEPDIHFTSGKSALRIPFELHNNQIYLHISVNNSKPLWVILDTGARTIINRSIAQMLGLKLQEQGQIQSTGESAFVKVALTKDVAFRLPGVTFTQQAVTVLAFENLERCLGHTADGILGLEFFNSSVVEIDYKERLVNIYDAKSYKYSGAGEQFQLNILSSGLVFVQASVTPSGRASVRGRFMIDTGFALSLFLNSPFVQENKLLDNTQGQDFSNCGIGGEAKAIKDKVGALELGSFKFNNLTAIFSLARSGINAASDVEGLIGGEILSRFKVIFDYSRQRMILETYTQS
jgi:predicted aspartyl protease